MSETGEETEPTLHDVLAAIRAVAATQAQHGRVLDGHSETLAGHGAVLDDLRLNFAARAELDESRHGELTQALESIAGLVYEQQVELKRSEARVTSRIGDVQAVVQALKADLAAHVSDTVAHRDTHGTAA